MKKQLKRTLKRMLCYIAILLFVVIISAVIAFFTSITIIGVTAIDSPTETFSSLLQSDFSSLFIACLKVNESVGIFLFSIIPARKWFEDE